MAALNTTAKAAIRAAGFTEAQWAAMWGYRGGKWGGDQCGCFDDRCANGFHHHGVNDCGCLQSMLDDAVAWRDAVRQPNRVAVAAPFGLFRYVDVSTPGALVTVSATAGSPGALSPRPEETVVRIEAREGWTATVGTDERGRMEVRLVKTVTPAAGEENDGG
jgi:hypothetical protein